MSGDAEPQAGPIEIDRDALRDLTARALIPQTYFGKGLDLADQDRQQIKLATSKAEAKLAPSFQDPDWASFQALVQEGSGKGVLMSFTTHDGTNVPTWCRDGGDSSPVRKDSIEGHPVIVVPTKIFDLFHWRQTIDSLNGIANTSSETLKGRMTKPLGFNLSQLSHLLKEPETDATQSS